MISRLWGPQSPNKPLVTQYAAMDWNPAASTRSLSAGSHIYRSSEVCQWTSKGFREGLGESAVVREGGNIMLGCFPAKGTGRLCWVEGLMDGPMYCKILRILMRTSFSQPEHWRWVVDCSFSMTVTHNIQLRQQRRGTRRRIFNSLKCNSIYIICIVKKLKTLNFFVSGKPTKSVGDQKDFSPLPLTLTTIFMLHNITPTLTSYEGLLPSLDHFCCGLVLKDLLHALLRVYLWV